MYIKYILIKCKYGDRINALQKSFQSRSKKFGNSVTCKNVANDAYDECTSFSVFKERVNNKQFCSDLNLLYYFSFCKRVLKCIWYSYNWVDWLVYCTLCTVHVRTLYLRMKINKKCTISNFIGLVGPVRQEQDGLFTF